MSRVILHLQRGEKYLENVPFQKEKCTNARTDRGEHGKFRGVVKKCLMESCV